MLELKCNATHQVPPHRPCLAHPQVRYRQCPQLPRRLPGASTSSSQTLFLWTVQYQTHRIEVAIENALTHPPLDPATAARQRAKRELIHQQREVAFAHQQQEQQEAQDNDIPAALHSFRNHGPRSNQHATVCDDSFFMPCL
ncbi:hypothetical protein ACA910_015037 [Epithemia clementina (nom. ined.)]